LFSWLRSCAYCHATWGRIDFYCENCWSKLWLQIAPTKSFVPGTDCSRQSLWIWRAQDPFMDAFVKKQKRLELWSARQRVLQKYLSIIDQELPDLVCGVGSTSDMSFVDHGWVWAQVLAQLIDRPTCLLTVENSQGYKGKGIQQRWRDRVVTGAQDLPASPRVWFIDDVTTTGTTAHAVWRALGRPKDYTAIGLVYRYPGFIE
jgi:predicted amidophosphoribosyltransferase